MPVIPNFTGFAATPNLAGSYNAGAALALSAQQAAAQLQMQRQKLAQDAQMAEMEMMAKREASQAAQLRQQQEMEMEKAYKEAQIGMQDRELKNSEARLALSVQDAAQKLAVQDQYRKRFQALTAGGMPADEAARTSMLEIDPSQFGGAGTASVRGNPNQMEFGAASPVAGLPEDYRQVQTGPGSRRIIRVPKEVDEQTEAKQAPGLPENYKLFDGKLVKLPDPNVPIRSEIKALRTAQEDDTNGLLAFGKSEEGKKLSPGEKLFLKKYEDRQRRIEELESQLKGGGSGAKPTVPTMDFSNATTNKIRGFEVIKLR